MEFPSADQLARLGDIFKSSLPAPPSRDDLVAVTTFKKQYLAAHSQMDHGIFATLLSFSIIETDKTTQLSEPDNTGIKVEIYRFTSTKYPEFRCRPDATSLRSVLDCNPGAVFDGLQSTQLQP